MSITVTHKPQTATRVWNIWAEGFTATGKTSTAWQLNETPVRADSFDDAVLMLIAASANKALFDRGRDGEWRYWGCRLYDNEADARASFG
jgi:hypothetical protein